MSKSEKRDSSFKTLIQVWHIQNILFNVFVNLRNCICRMNGKRAGIFHRNLLNHSTFCEAKLRVFFSFKSWICPAYYWKALSELIPAVL